MAHSKKEIEIIWSEKIKQSDFDYEEFVKGIEFPEGSKWFATIIE